MTRHEEVWIKMAGLAAMSCWPRHANNEVIVMSKARGKDSTTTEAPSYLLRHAKAGWRKIQRRERRQHLGVGSLRERMLPC